MVNKDLNLHKGSINYLAKFFHYYTKFFIKLVEKLMIAKYIVWTGTQWIEHMNPIQKLWDINPD